MAGSGRAREVNVTANLRLVPRFNERDPDTFFTLFERVSSARQWSDAEKILLLQCVLTGKAQESYTAVCAQENLTYATVKQTVLKAYQLTAEAYRQRFRQWMKADKQTHVEFVRDLMSHFQRWCVAVRVTTFEGLVELMVLEQFKNTLPGRVVTYLNEREPESVSRAAQLADDFVLTHQGFGSGVRVGSGGKTEEPSAARPAFKHVPSRKQGPAGRPGRSGGSSGCHYCRGEGHWKDQCPLLRSKGGAPSPAPSMLCATTHEPRAVTVNSHDISGFEPFITSARVSLAGSNDSVGIKVLRDTGAKHSFVVQSVLPFSEGSQTGDFIVMHGMELGFVPVPRHNVFLECDFVKGAFPVGVRPALPLEGVSMILGNDICGSAVWASGPPPPVVVPKPLPPDLTCESSVFPVCAVTRAQSKKELTDEPQVDVKAEAVLLPALHVSRCEWVKAQKVDKTLSTLWEQVLPNVQIEDAAQGYFVYDNLLVRKWSPCEHDVMGEPVYQIVVPDLFRAGVLKTAHDRSGHFGVRKTYLHVLKHFFWPHAKKDVASYIRSCHVCQLTGKPNQKIKPAPLQPIPAVSEPFEYLIIDCVGPLPISKSGCKFLLTVMCQSTRYPAAYPLRTITTKAVVRALSQFISVFGIPKIIQSDRGSNFSSHMFAQVLKTLGVKHNQSTAYHAQSQGALERFHQSLKSLLRAYCTELSRDWEQGLPWLLLAAREAG